MGLETLFGINSFENALFDVGTLNKIYRGIISEEILSYTKPQLDELGGKQKALFYELGEFLISGNLEENINFEFSRDLIKKIKEEGCNFNDREILSIALNLSFGKLSDDDKIKISKYFYLFNVSYLHNFRDFVIDNYERKNDFSEKMRFLSTIIANYYGDTNFLLDIFNEIGINSFASYLGLINPLRQIEENIIKSMIQKGFSEEDIRKYIVGRRIFNM